MEVKFKKVFAFFLFLFPCPAFAGDLVEEMDKAFVPEKNDQPAINVVVREYFNIGGSSKNAIEYLKSKGFNIKSYKKNGKIKFVCSMYYKNFFFVVRREAVVVIESVEGRIVDVRGDVHVHGI